MQLGPVGRGNSGWAGDLDEENSWQRWRKDRGNLMHELKVVAGCRSLSS